MIRIHSPRDRGSPCFRDETRNAAAAARGCRQVIANASANRNGNGVQVSRESAAVHSEPRSSQLEVGESHAGESHVREEASSQAAAVPATNVRTPAVESGSRR